MTNPKDCDENKEGDSEKQNPDIKQSIQTKQCGCGGTRGKKGKGKSTNKPKKGTSQSEKL